MPATYEVNTDVGKVRLLISDVGGESGTDWLFGEDSEIEAFLAMEADVYSAAATALRTIAANEALVSKRIKFLELTTDGPAVAKELRELAAALDEKSENSSDGDEDWDPIVEIVTERFGRRQQRLGY